MGFPGCSGSKESACSEGDLSSVSELGRSLDKGMKPTLVFLPGESPWTEEPGGLQATVSPRV